MHTWPFAILILSTTSLAAPYDKLFEVGTTMTYDENSSVTFGNSAPRTESTRTTCRVATVSKIAGANVASIECDTKSRVAGHWMATKRGLWHLNHATADDVKETLRGGWRTRIIAARPTKGVRDATDREGMGERTVTKKKKGSWCVESESGDPNGYGTSTYCFANGVLVEWSTSGNWYGEGGGSSAHSTVIVSKPAVSTPKATP